MPIWLPVNSSDVSSKRRGRVEEGQKAYSHRVPTLEKSRQDRKVRPADFFYRSRWIRRAIGSYSVNIQWNVSRREIEPNLNRITFNPEQCGGDPDPWYAYPRQRRP